MIKKLFGPINRWQFFIALFIISIINSLSSPFTLFLAGPIYATDIMLHMIFYTLIIYLFIFYKRFVDISCSFWKSFLISMSFVISILAYMQLSSERMVNSVIGGNVSIYPIIIFYLYNICLLLLLLFKKGKNDTKPFEWKVALRRAVIVILIALTVNAIPYRTGFAINSGMMYPTIMSDDTWLITKVTKNRTLNRGDIVAEKTDYRLRRIIGLPNETVEMRGKEIYINSKLFDDKYAFYSEKLEPINFQKTFKLDNNQYLLIGDNRYFTEGGKILGKGKEGVESWRPLREKSIYIVVPKENLVAKVVGIHYIDYDRETKKWKSAGFAFAFKGKTFEHNYKRHSIFDRMFLKEN